MYQSNPNGFCIFSVHLSLNFPPLTSSPTSCITIFSLCFVCLTSENNFSLMHTRASSLSCFVLSPAPCCSGLALLSLLFPHSFLFLSLISLLLSFSFDVSWCFLFILPAKLSEVLHWEMLTRSSWPVLEGCAGSDTYTGARRLAHCTACWNESRSSPRVLCTTHCEKSGK